MTSRKNKNKIFEGYKSDNSVIKQSGNLHDAVKYFRI